MSGYRIKAEFFIAADPRSPDSMQRATALLDDIRNNEWAISDCAGDWVSLPTPFVGEPIWIARRKPPAPITPASAEPRAQDRAAPDAALPGASGAGEDMPDGPAFMRRVPR